ncbi:hypothetical protein MN608_05727 [Microdochium nivale]|nr:hypothetical protein MN608_05727 [Microdochium nivale]
MAADNTTANSKASASTDLESRLSFKEQLDRAAFEAKNPDAGRPEPTIIDKVTEYVPAVGKLLGKTSSSDPNDSSSDSAAVAPDVPPRRPDHDEHIEEFVRDQHRSKQPGSKTMA